MDEIVATFEFTIATVKNTSTSIIDTIESLRFFFRVIESFIPVVDDTVGETALEDCSAVDCIEVVVEDDIVADCIEVVPEVDTGLL